MKRSETDLPNSEEWRSVLTAVQDIDIRAIPPTRTHKGFVAYTDGACLNNPGGPAGWSALLWSALDSADGHVRKGAPCIECYGYIPLAPTTTNNRAEIAAVLAALSLAPPALPLTIYSDSEYVIKVAQGEYKMTKNPDLWEIYRKLERSRRETPLFLWVAGHTGHPHNDRADELAGLGAFNGDCTAYGYRCQYPYVPFVMKSCTLHEPCRALGIDYSALWRNDDELLLSGPLQAW